MKQYKVSLLQHYVTFPFRYHGERFKWWISVMFNKLRRKITKRWYCAGCETYHSGRVYAFSLVDFFTDGYCGLHLDAERTYTLMLGGRIMTAVEVTFTSNRLEFSSK